MDIRFEIKHDFGHCTYKNNINDIVKVNRNQYYAATTNELIKCDESRLINTYNYQFIAAVMAEYDLFLGITYTGNELTVIDMKSMNEPIIKGFKLNMLSVFHMLYSKSSHSIIVFGSCIKVFTLTALNGSWKIQGKASDFDIKQRSSFAEGYSNPILNKPAFDYERELILIPTPNGVGAYNLDGKLVKYLTKLPLPNTAMVAYHPESRKIFTSDTTNGAILWDRYGNLVTRFSISSVILSAHFVNKEHIFYINPKGYMFILNTKTQRSFVCNTIEKFPQRIFVFCDERIRVGMCTGNRMDFYLVKIPWKVWAKNINNPIAIERVSSYNRAARICVYTVNSLVKMFSPKTAKLLTSATPIQNSQHKSSVYDRGLCEYYDGENRIVEQTTSPDSPRDQLFLLLRSKLLTMFSTGFSPCEQIKTMPMNFDFMVLAKYRGEWSYCFASNNGSISFADYEHLRFIRRFVFGSNRALIKILYLPITEEILLVFKDALALFDTVNGRLISEYEIRGTDVVKVFKDIVYLGYKDGSILFITYKDHHFELLNTGENQKFHDGAVTDFTFSNNVWASSSLDQTIILWDYDFVSLKVFYLPLPIVACEFLNAKHDILVATDREVMVIPSHYIDVDNDEEVAEIDNFDRLEDDLNEFCFLPPDYEEEEDMAEINAILNKIDISKKPKDPFAPMNWDELGEKLFGDKEGFKLLLGDGDDPEKKKGDRGFSTNEVSYILQEMEEFGENDDENGDGNGKDKDSKGKRKGRKRGSNKNGEDGDDDYYDDDYNDNDGDDDDYDGVDSEDGKDGKKGKHKKKHKKNGGKSKKDDSEGNHKKKKRRRGDDGKNKNKDSNHKNSGDSGSDGDSKGGSDNDTNASKDEQNKKKRHKKKSDKNGNNNGNNGDEDSNGNNNGDGSNKDGSDIGNNKNGSGNSNDEGYSSDGDSNDNNGGSNGLSKDINIAELLSKNIFGDSKGSGNGNSNDNNNYTNGKSSSKPSKSRRGRQRRSAKKKNDKTNDLFMNSCRADRGKGDDEGCPPPKDPLPPFRPLTPPLIKPVTVKMRHPKRPNSATLKVKPRPFEPPDCALVLDPDQVVHEFAKGRHEFACLIKDIARGITSNDTNEKEYFNDAAKRIPSARRSVRTNGSSRRSGRVVDNTETKEEANEEKKDQKQLKDVKENKDINNTKEEKDAHELSDDKKTVTEPTMKNKSFERKSSTVRPLSSDVFNHLNSTRRPSEEDIANQAKLRVLTSYNGKRWPLSLVTWLETPGPYHRKRKIEYDNILLEQQEEVVTDEEADEMLRFMNAIKESRKKTVVSARVMVRKSENNGQRIGDDKMDSLQLAVCQKVPEAHPHPLNELHQTFNSGLYENSPRARYRRPCGTAAFPRRSQMQMGESNELTTNKYEITKRTIQSSPRSLRTSNARITVPSLRNCYTATVK